MVKVISVSLITFFMFLVNAHSYSATNHPTKKGYKKITCDSGKSTTMYNTYDMAGKAEAFCGEKQDSKFKNYGKSRNSGGSANKSDSSRGSGSSEGTCTHIDKNSASGCSALNDCMQSKSFCQFADGRPSCGCGWSERDSVCRCSKSK